MLCDFIHTLLERCKVTGYLRISLYLAAIPLMLLAIVLDVILIISENFFGVFKSRLIRFFQKRYSRQIIAEIEKMTERKSTNSTIKNLSGLGGQDFNPAFISWSELSGQCDDKTLRQWAYSPNVIKESLFFEYFGPLEAWCETNCRSDFYLWSDKNGVYRQFTDPMDAVLWKLTFNGSMPTYREVLDITKNRII